jgi:hypothetical protein
LKLAIARPVVPLPGLAQVARLAPTALLLLGALRLAWSGRGSIAGSDWLGWAVAALVLLAVVLAFDGARRPSRAGLVSLGGLVGLALWTFVSVAWSPAPALGRDEGFLVLLYAAAFAIPLVTLRTAADRLWATGLTVAALGGLSVAIGLRLRLADDPNALYAYGRLAFPLTYANAQAALVAVGFWPAVALAARQRGSVALRAGALAAAVAILSSSLLAQSKGSAVGLAVSAVVFFALSPLRLRALVPTAVAVLLTAAAFGALTAPFRAETEAQRADAIRHAGTVVVLLTLAALAVGAAYVLLDRRLVLSPRARRAAGLATLAALGVAVTVGLALFVARVDSPTTFLGDKWRSFKTLPVSERTGTHFGSLGSNRYDFWRVALHEFADHPVAGIGARGFQAAYLVERRAGEEPARAHSLPLDVLAETGLVGFALLALGVGVALVALLVRGRAAAGAAALAAAGVYFVVHFSVDWIWTFPAAGVPLFLLLGTGLASASARRLPRRASRAAAAVVVVMAALAATPWLSARLSERAPSQPTRDRALRDVRLAKRLDPLSTRPYMVDRTLAPTLADRLPPVRAAVAKEPRSWALHYLLALDALAAGRRGEARSELQIAERLNPREPAIESALRAARG